MPLRPCVSGAVFANDFNALHG
ncbi:hypothetical protein BDI4_300067 [Burkholderia diffusa]|nr:hypothetical protein BDI4_300067 [Burkholderia diffusa]